MSDLFALLSFGSGGWGDELLAGVWLTLRLALATLPFGIMIGLGVALMKNSENRVLRVLGDLYTTIFRGLPELLTIFIVYFGGQILLNKFANLLSEGATVQVNGFVAGIAALALVLGAFSSEVFLGAIRGVPAGQTEAAKALGLTKAQAFRLILLPQLWRLALPGLSNNWLVLLKDTSLVSVIALSDLMRMTNVAVGATKQPFFFYLIACLIYLALSGVSTLIAQRLEARADRGFAGMRH